MTAWKSLIFRISPTTNIKYRSYVEGDIGMSSADPPNRFDRSAGAAHVNQPCGEIFFLWPELCDHDGVKNTSWSLVLTSNSY